LKDFFAILLAAAMLVNIFSNNLLWPGGALAGMAVARAL
jgi:hypothetical protein